jgi:hypothetical protein
MFIININEKDWNLYRCSKVEAFKLQREGFPLLGIDDGVYCFAMTEKLRKFLNPEGGENS